jgi:hypothetical protein
MKTALVFLAAFLSVAQGSGPTPADQLLTRLALESAGDAETPGIEIKIEGGRQFAVYDRFRLVALAAREALRAGHPLDPAAPPKALLEPRMIVLAYARMPMSGDPVQPQFVQINGRSGKRLKAEEIRTWLPGVTVPGDTVAVSFAIASLKPSDRIAIVFNERVDVMSSPPGSGGIRGTLTPGTLTAPVDFTTPEALDTPSPVVPPGVTLPAPRVDVHVEGVLDLSGRVRFARALDGPAELHPAAAEAVGRWRYKPATMFHVPIPLVMKATVTFTRDNLVRGASPLGLPDTLSRAPLRRRSVRVAHSLPLVR